MKSNAKDAMDNAIARMRFGMTAAEAKEKGICVKCKQPVQSFQNNLMINHYQDSGLCESCSSSTSP